MEKKTRNKKKADSEKVIENRQAENERTYQRQFSIDVNCVNLQKLITSEGDNILKS